MLDEILRYHLPDTWDKSITYSPKNYRLITLDSTGSEYQQVTAAFKDMVILKVERIQNPYIYGRFKIRKEYLELTGSVLESTAYHPVNVEDVIVVADYNCDTRRYAKGNSSQISGKNPKFYSTPSSAVAYHGPYGEGTIAVIVVTLLNADNAWDAQYLPEYVVYLE